MAAETPDTHEPHIQVLKGNPTDEELAALIAVLGSAAGGGGEPATAGADPLGPARRQTALPSLQLAEDHPAGTDSHAAMTARQTMSRRSRIEGG